MRFLRIISIFLGVALVGLGCQTVSSPTPMVSPLSAVSVLQSPVVTPLPTELESTAPVFEIDVPVYAGATALRGSGLAGVPLRLVDVSEVGAELGTTVVDANGRFEFQLSTPLIAGHTVGLQIGDLSGTSFNYSDFERGDTYYDRPLVGVLFDIAPVQEAP